MRLKNKRKGVKTGTVRAVDRALAILKCFSGDNEQLSLGEISERVLLPKSTVHRLITSLENAYFLEQDQLGGEYRLGHEIIRLGVVALESIDLCKIARPEMKWLSDKTKQTSNLYVIQDYHRICIEQVKGPQYVRRHSFLGARLPLYCGASGKVLLAYAGEELLEGLFSNVKLEKLTNNTMVDKGQIINELIKIKEQGYAVTLAEREPISASVAAPVFDYGGNIVASLAVSGPVQVFTDDKVEHYVPVLLQASGKISKKLGYLS